MFHSRKIYSSRGHEISDLRETTEVIFLFGFQRSAHNPMVNSMDGDAVAPNRRLEGRLFKWRPSFPVLARWFLKTAMWLVFLEWVIMIFLYPSPSLVGTFLKWFYATDTSFYGLVGRH